MGIPKLNQYLRDNCKKGIESRSLNSLRGKPIVIDASIYLYRYLSENALIENLYLMITKLRLFNIPAIFVFDGKPPIEKYDEIERRYQKKISSKQEYDKIYEIYKNSHDIHERSKLKYTLDCLRRQFIKLTTENIIEAKQLIISYGMQYIDAPGEADIICAKLVQKKIAYACLSEDMDMFVYGCKRVLRYLSLMNSTVIFYDLDVILSELNISFKNFRDICLISGSDYEKNMNRNIYKTFKMFDKYVKQIRNNKQENISFYNWLIDNTSYISSNFDIEKLENMFDLTTINMKDIELDKIYIRQVDSDILTEILSNNGFIFI